MSWLGEFLIIISFCSLLKLLDNTTIILSKYSLYFKIPSKIAISLDKNIIFFFRKFNILITTSLTERNVDESDETGTYFEISYINSTLSIYLFNWILVSNIPISSIISIKFISN